MNRVETILIFGSIATVIGAATGGLKGAAVGASTILFTTHLSDTWRTGHELAYLSVELACTLSGGAFAGVPGAATGSIVAFVGSTIHEAWLDTSSTEL